MTERGEVAEAEAWEVFNMGCGFVAVVPEAHADAATEILAAHHPGARRIGTVTDEAGRASVAGGRYSSGQGSRSGVRRLIAAGRHVRLGRKPLRVRGAGHAVVGRLALPVLARVGDLLAEPLGALLS